MRSCLRTRLRLYTVALASFLTASTLVGCSDNTDDKGADSGAAAPSSHVVEENTRRTVLNLIDELPQCDIDHRGLLFDMGSDVLHGRHAHWLNNPKGIVATSHDGATWDRIYERGIKLRFVLARPTKVFVTLRAIGRNSRRATVIVDKFVLSHLSLKKDEASILKTRTSGLPLDAGEHMVEVRFRGYRRTDSNPFAEIDWLRVGIPDTKEGSYNAPTMGAIISPSAQLGGIPHKAIGLHGSSLVRCAMQVPAHARLQTSVGFMGAGSGLAEFVARDDKGDTHVLGRKEVRGGENAVWSEVDASMHPLAGRLVSLEIRVPRTTGSGRLVIGDPRVTVPRHADPVLQPAKRTIVVMLNGVSRDDIPPWRKSASPHLPTLNELARTGVVFNDHRTSSTLIAAAAASTLTGLEIWQHNLADSGASMPGEVRTIGQQAGEASVRAGFFTGVPLTFEAFGFGKHWDKYQTYPPNEGRPGWAPFEGATAWLKSADPARERKMLAVVMTRGGHPPWDVTPKEARDLPPVEYAGSLSPRRAAQQLHDLAGRFSRLSDSDRERLRALFLLSLSRQDAALGRMITALKEDNLWNDTLLIVMGDVASARREMFKDGSDMLERVLQIPLLVHFPNNKRAPQHVDQPTTHMDIAVTALQSLGVKPSEDMRGVHLERVAASADERPRHMRLAVTDERYSLRWGQYALTGAVNKRPRLCDIQHDPSCAFDRSRQHPFITEAMFRELADRYRALAQAPTRVPLSLDTPTAGMLEVWGAN